MIKKILLVSSFSLFCLFLFLIITFPLERVGPRIARVVESNLSRSLRGTYECQLDDLSLHFPLGFQSSKFSCQSNRENLFNFHDLSVTLLPWVIRVSSGIGQGQMDLQIQKSLFSMSFTKLDVSFQDTPLTNLMPLIFQMAKQVSPAVIGIEMTGMLQGEASIPLIEFSKKSGHLDIQIKNFKLPAQSTLELIGLTELNFQIAQAKAGLEDGVLDIQEIAFIAPEMGGKVNGSLKLDEENMMDSSGELTLKWKFQKSDALLNSLLGPQLLNGPCPSPDSQGFCTRKINRLSEVMTLFSPAGSRFR